MGLLDELVMAQAKKGPPCSVSVLKSTLAPDEAAQLEEIIATRHDIYAATIARHYENRANAGAISRHRARSCACFKTA